MLEFRYDTQLLIEGEHLDEAAINDHFLNHFQGDCLLAVGDEELIKIHYHTNEPWRVLEYCASLGEIYDIVIEDTTSSKYYVFKVTQVDPNKFEDDAIDAIVSTGSSEITNASNVYWLDKYEFNVYDKDIYDGLKAIDEKYVD